MANELQAVAEPGLTLTASLVRGNVIQATGIALTEVTPGFYVGSVPMGTPYGSYAVLVYDGGDIVASGVLEWDGTSEIAIGITGQRVRELHLIHGLEVGAPLSVSEGARSANYVSQTITDDGTTTVVQRA